MTGIGWISITDEEGIKLSKAEAQARDQAYKQLVDQAETQRKQVTANVGPNRRETESLSGAVGKLHAKRASINQQIEIREVRMLRPWAVISTSPRVHDTSRRDPDFDYKDFDKKNAVQFLERTEAEIRELKAERLVLQCELEPLEARLRELHQEWMSLQAQLEACRPPDRTLFDIEWNKQQWLSREAK